MRIEHKAVIAGIALLLGAGGVRAQEASPPAGAEDLAKKLSNPISDLVSVPFQYN